MPGVRLFLAIWVLKMSKASQVILSILAVFLPCPAAVAAPDDCRATEIAINSYVIRGDVVLVKNGRAQSPERVEVDTYEFREGEWQPRGTIESKSGFGWLAERIGRYKFVVRHEGFQNATLIVNVRRLNSKWRVIIIPLKVGDCAHARLGRRG